MTKDHGGVVRRDLFHNILAILTFEVAYVMWGIFAGQSMFVPLILFLATLLVAGVAIFGEPVLAGRILGALGRTGIVMAAAYAIFVPLILTGLRHELLTTVLQPWLPVIVLLFLFGAVCLVLKRSLR